VRFHSSQVIGPKPEKYVASAIGRRLGVLLHRTGLVRAPDPAGAGFFALELALVL
jgi:hypothetical protein